MCEPTTIAIALATVAAASEVASVVSEHRAAKAQNKAISEQYTAQVEEVRDAESADINERLRAARKERGRVKVAAGEAGLQFGGSVAGLLQDSVMQSALYDERVRSNAGNRIDSATAEANSMYSRVQDPTLLGAGLRVVGAGINGYAAGAGLQLSRANASKAS